MNAPLPWHDIEFRRIVGSRGKIPHALLIRGRQGIGKHAFAMALAQALLCEAPTSAGTACGGCAACGWMKSAAHPDLRIIEPAASAEGDEEGQGGDKKAGRQITVEQIRELPDFINVSSHRGGHRIVLVHPAEALNANAANALLKSLEEPPAGACFILVTHRVHYLLPTVVSRCRQIVLPAPAPTVAADWLRAQGMADPALALAQTGNSPLAALQLDSEEYWQRRDFLLQRIAKEVADPLEVAESIRDYPVADVVNWLQKWTYDLVLSRCRGEVRYNPDFRSELAALARRVGTLPALRFHRATVRMQRIVHHPLNPRLLLEQLLIDYAALLETGTP